MADARITMEGNPAILAVNSTGAGGTQTPRFGFLSKHKGKLFAVCCITCLLLEAFILLYSTVDGKKQKDFESDDRLRIALDNVFLRLLALPGGSREARHNPYNDTGFFLGNNTTLF